MNTAVNHSHFVKLLLCALVPGMSFTGCTFGSIGTLAAKRTCTGTAEVLQIYSLGLQLRPRAFDAGITAGYRHSSYFYPRTDGKEPTESWHWFHAPLPNDKPIVVMSKSMGLEASVTRETRRVSAGYLQQMSIEGPAPGESLKFEFYYNQTNLAETVLKLEKPKL